MKAISLHEPTGISGLVYEEVPDAKPMACDVLVKVAACGITHARACNQGVHREGRRRHPRQDRPAALIFELPAW